MTCLWDQGTLFQAESNFWPVDELLCMLVGFLRARRCTKNERAAENGELDALTTISYPDNVNSSSLLDKLSLLLEILSATMAVGLLSWGRSPW